jgi:hypothetical protein
MIEMTRGFGNWGEFQWIMGENRSLRFSTGAEKLYRVITKALPSVDFTPECNDLLRAWQAGQMG